MQPLSEYQRPDLLTSPDISALQMSHACHRFWKCYKAHVLCSSRLTRCTIPCACHAKRHLNVQKWSEHVVFLNILIRNVLRATRARTFSTCQLQKVLRVHHFLPLLTLKCALRHNGVHFFDISTSKSGLRRCGFYILTSKCAATAYTFSTSQLPKVLRT